MTVRERIEEGERQFLGPNATPVSYTHLTLPTTQAV